MRKFELDEIVQMKKKHPCGCDKWKVIRLGVDIKAQCLGCGHIIMVPRTKFLKMLKNTPKI